MNAEKAAEFRDLIEARKMEILQEDALSEKSQTDVALDQQRIGRLSRMDALQNQAMSHAQRGRRAIELKKLQHALVRLDAEDYGYCEDCDEVIPEGRLRIDLTATLCISCARG